VIGEVLTCVKHPNADKLSITTVNVGSGSPSQIVCGASNVAAGQKVLLHCRAQWSILPKANHLQSVGKNSPVSKVRDDLFLKMKSEWATVIQYHGVNTAVKNGTPASEFFKVESDYVFEIGLTPNRADAASHIGVARDIKAVKKRDINFPSVEILRFQIQTHFPVV